jgi:murein DD-endopeptidase MepM/ murein hydrolase activator NlpD
MTSMRGLPLILAILLGSAPARARDVALEMQPGLARPGDLVVIRVRGATAAPTGKLGDLPLEFHPYGDGFIALAGLSVDEKPGALPLQVAVPHAKVNGPLEGTLDIDKAGFRERQLKVQNKFIAPPPAVKKRMQEDREAFAKAFAQPSKAPLFTANFVWPRHDYLTGLFGDRRVFNGKLGSQHYGLDLDGDIGAPIVATNDGEAVMVRDCYASGLTVVLYHGAHLYSVYFHLSKVDVVQGAQVKRGEKIGAVGKSGRVTGPHLHWGVKVGGRYVDGASLIRSNFE